MSLVANVPHRNISELQNRSWGHVRRRSIVSECFSYLGHPTSNEESGSKALLLIPDLLCRGYSFCMGHGRIAMRSCHRFLSCRVHHFFSVVRVVHPPQDREKYRPYGTKKMVRHEYMSKVERSFGIFLATCKVVNS